jgi:fatty-acyl-CoA synthase
VTDLIAPVDHPASATGDPAPERPWLQASFGAALEWGAATWGDREAVVYGDERYSFARFATRVRSFARGLVAMGVAPGEKIALWMGDRPEWLVARWAVPMMGAVLVPVNTRLRDADVKVVLAQSDATTLIIQDDACGTDFLAILAELVPDYAAQPRGAWSAPALPALRRVIGFSGIDARDAHARAPRAAHPALPPSMCRFEEVERCGGDRIVAAALACAPGPEAAQFVAEAAASGADEVLQARMDAVAGDDVAQILYTAGFSAQPRGAMQCHGALLQNNAYAAECLGLSTADRYLSCVPLFTAPGTSYTLASWLAGAATVIVDEFDPALFCETVERERITVTFFVDTIVQDLRGFAHVANYDLSSLRTGTGTPLPTASFLWITKMLGVPQLVSVYGLSEASGAVTRTRTTDALVKRSATHGRPVEGMRIRIADVQTNQTLPGNVVGEICVAGDTVMRGYYGMPEEQAHCVDADGWFHTGDLGELDADGFLVYRGRVKEMIKPGGFSVATQEIEVFLKTWPGVREVAVIGLPDPRLGEVPYAFVQAIPGKAVDPEALRAYCKAHIASYKVPRWFEFVDEWPQAPGGRIRKSELRVRAVATRARAQALDALDRRPRDDGGPPR